jgi:photosystem II stability/assembly factor-like uncharacterized protein
MSTLLAIGTRKGLFLATSDERTTWDLSEPHFPMQAIYAVGIDTRVASPRLLVGADSNHWGPSVFHSDDLGATWREPERAPVAFPEDTDGALARVWQLQPGPADEPGVVWAGAEPASLFRSDDGGLSFELVRALWDHPHRPAWAPGAGGMCLHTIIPHGERLVTAISAAGVYRSLDGGQSWNASNTGIEARFFPDRYPEFGQCVHKIAADAEDPDRLYLQNHGGVYRSDDGGASWNPIHDGLPADFGFAMVAHPRRGDTAFLYPLVSDEHRVPPDGASRVFATADGGETWQARAGGLPTEHVYGTVLRDAMCADHADPTGLYFGNRNGEVWASADEGEHWQAVATHLPDVLSVRAATLA